MAFVLSVIPQDRWGGNDVDYIDAKRVIISQNTQTVDDRECKIIIDIELHTIHCMNRKKGRSRIILFRDWAAQSVSMHHSENEVRDLKQAIAKGFGAVAVTVVNSVVRQWLDDRMHWGGDTHPTPIGITKNAIIEVE